MKKSTTKKEEKSITVIEKEVSPIVSKAQALLVNDQKSMVVATEMREKLKFVLKGLTVDKEKVTKPLNEALREVRLRYKPLEDQLNMAIEAINSKMSTHQTEAIRKQKEEEAKIASRVGEGRGKIGIETAIKKIENVEKPATHISTVAGGARFRTDKILKIVDESKIPRDYLIPDKTRILVDLKGGKPVEGCEIEEIQTPVSTRS